MPDVSILMPVYNERATVVEAIERALDAALPVESRQLVVVDDGSTDGTREVSLHFHDRNGGKGAAVRTAIEHASGRWAAILDADLEYDPVDIGRLLEPLQSGEAEVVYGVRGFDSRSAYSFWYVAGNKAVTLVANVLFNSWLADIMTCHKAMPTDAWRSLNLSARGFELEGEITARVLASGRRIYEVPITYRARGREEGKKLTGIDALRVVRTLARERLRAT
jgi:glycosyltransferase involved in cell wall biosynthesis